MLPTATLRAAYGRLPAPLRARVPLKLEAWLRGTAMPRLAGLGPVGGLEARLWGGFSQPARAELLAIADDPAAPARHRVAAAMALARWHGAADEPELALARLRAAGAALPALGRRREARLLEALFLCQSGREAEARDVLAAARLRDTDMSAALLRVTAETDPVARFAALNRAMARAGLSGLAPPQAGAAPGFDTLRGLAPPRSVPGPLVTVIVPAFRAEATLGVSLQSLADQTWAELEVIVVDDASPDGTAAVAAAFALRDPRFRLLAQPENGGAYLGAQPWTRRGLGCLCHRAGCR